MTIGVKIISYHTEFKYVVRHNYRLLLYYSDGVTVDSYYSFIKELSMVELINELKLRLNGDIQLL